VSLYSSSIWTSLTYSEVELCEIIRDRILSLDGMLEDGYHAHQEINSLLRRLANPFEKRDDAGSFEKNGDGNNENGKERGDESMDVD
jgi:hypothetical protein